MFTSCIPSEFGFAYFQRLLLGKLNTMRKLLSLLTCLLFTSLVEAQILNPGFELLNTDSTLMNWRFAGILSIGMNDSLLDDGFILGKSTDAHSGQYALELRNAFNITTNAPVYHGSVVNTLPDSNLYQGFTTFIPISGKPTSLQFYYKFSQNPYQDSAKAWIRIYNNAQIEIGYAQIVFWDLAPNYQFMQIPITYNLINGQLDSIPAFVSIGFSNLIHLAAGPHVGQRTLIDDLSLGFTPLSVPMLTSDEIHCFPNPVRNTLFIQNAEPAVSKTLYNQIGQQIIETTGNQINVSELTTGIYFLRLNSNSKQEIIPIIKE